NFLDDLKLKSDQFSCISNFVVCAVQEQMLCNSQCVPELGCWGPSQSDCVHCCGSKAGDQCVDVCPNLSGYYQLAEFESKSWFDSSSACRTTQAMDAQQMDLAVFAARLAQPEQCAPCHPECAASCQGPRNDQCKGMCKHVEVSRNGGLCICQLIDSSVEFNNLSMQNDGRCEAKCPQGRYPDQETHTCTNCSKTCPVLAGDKAVCTGPGTHLGFLGCQYCLYVIESERSVINSPFCQYLPPKSIPFVYIFL
ncbi:Receptor tyrosine-protein kinase erbB-2, partial [Cichlidogyrus casuarinus]